MSGLRKKLRLAVLFLLVPISAHASDLRVTGMGWWENLKARRMLEQFQPEEDQEEGLFSIGFLEDAIVLLRSRVERQGYLNPLIELELRDRDGEIRLLEGDVTGALDLDFDLEIEAVTFSVERPRRYFYADIQIRGLDRDEADDAKAFFYPTGYLLGLKRYRAYSPELLDRSLRNLTTEYRNRGYREAQVTLDLLDQDDTTGAVKVVAVLEKGPLHWVEETRLEAGVSLDADLLAQLRQTVQEAIAQPYTPRWESRSTLRLRNQLYEEGYPFAQTSLRTDSLPENEREKRLNTGEEMKKIKVTARIQPGSRVWLREFRFEGLHRTNLTTVSRAVDSAEGELLSRLDIESSRRNLMNLGVFESVRAEIVPIPDAALSDSVEVDARDVVFQLQEQSLREVYLRGGYGSYEGLRSGVEVEYRNPFGRAHRIRGLALYSLKSTHARVSYTAPALGGYRLRWTTTASWLQREEVSFDREEWTFDNKILSFWQAKGIRLMAGYRFEQLNTRNFESLEKTVERSVRSAGFELGMLRDRRDNPVQPTAGDRLRGNLEWANSWFGSATDYQRVELSYAYHREWKRRWNFHLGLEHGALLSLGAREEDVPLNKRFFPGGENSIRGYREGQASPRDGDGIFIGAAAYWLLQAELERSLSPDVKLVLFTDQLYQSASERDYPGNEWLGSVGIGLRYHTVFGPVRLEYGHNLERRIGDPKGTLHFSLGLPF